MKPPGGAEATGSTSERSKITTEDVTAAAAFTSVNPHDLVLPECPIARPGDRVVWWTGGRRIEGVVRGHDIEGRPLIVNQHGNPIAKESFESIRIADPFQRVRPNWHDLREQGQILRPPSDILVQFRELLSTMVPPGLRYMDLVDEIWGRGFEVFLVGGTVRDVLAFRDSNDVDLVTTMPLRYLFELFYPMYKYRPSVAAQRGFVRVGGKPKSGDPFIDLKVFSDSLAGTKEATFGVGFERDCGHRDFSCNALYFDPKNEVIIDPCGNGLSDALAEELRLVCKTHDPNQYAKIYVRFWKFMARGLTPAEGTLDEIREKFAPCLSGLHRAACVSYFRSQVTNKAPDLATARSTMAFMSDLMREHGFEDDWQSFIAPLIEDILEDRANA